MLAYILDFIVFMKLLNVLLKLLFAVPGEMENNPDSTLLMEFKFKVKYSELMVNNPNFAVFSKQPFIGFVQSKMF